MMVTHVFVDSAMIMARLRAAARQGDDARCPQEVRHARVQVPARVRNPGRREAIAFLAFPVEAAH